MSLTVSLSYALFTKNNGHSQHLKADCTFEDGITAIVGPSGSGKSSFAHLIAGLLKPAIGTIKLHQHCFFDSQTNTNIAPQQRGIGYVFQDNALFPHLSVKDNILFGSPDKSLSPLMATIEAFQITPLLDRFPKMLSGGEAKRVAIIRALAAKPNILILDEALTGLDRAKKERLLDYLKILKQQFKGPILMMTHQMEDVLRLADHVSIIKDHTLSRPQNIMHIMQDNNFKKEFQLTDNINFLSGSIINNSDEICTLQVGNHHFKSYLKNATIGQDVRLYFEPKDISIALTKPEDTSILNIMHCSVRSITKDENGVVYVELQLENSGTQMEQAPLSLMAAITQQSLKNLALKPQQKVYALIKALSVLP